MIIEISTHSYINSSTRFMTAEFSLDDDHAVEIGKVFMTKKFNNRMSKEKQKAVKSFLKEHAGKSFKVKHGSTIELVFNQDKSKVQVTFQQKQSKEE